MRQGLIVAVMALWAGTSGAATLVDLDATTGATGSLSLGPGRYEVVPVVGSFTAWNAWGEVLGCVTPPTGCERGWLNQYTISSPDLGTRLVADGVRYETPAAAQAAAEPFGFTLAGAQTVSFRITDSNHADNLGGLTLSVAAVPVPPALASLLGGLAGLWLIAARRRGG